MRNIPLHTQKIIDSIAWFFAILITFIVDVKIYESLYKTEMPTKLFVMLVPSLLVAFIGAVMIKLILSSLYLIADHLAQRDIDKWHKK